MENSKRVIVHEVAIREILRLVAKNKLRSGDKLPPERELARQLGISRSCVREALQVLELNFIVRIKHGSGIYIDTLDETFIAFHLEKLNNREVLLMLRNLVEMRILTETHGFRQAAKTITPEQIRQLYAFESKEYARLMDRENADATMDLEHQIISIQPNTVLTNTHKQLETSWKRYMHMNNSVALPTGARHKDHLAIIQAIESKNDARIVKAVASHLDKTVEAMDIILARQKR